MRALLAAALLLLLGPSVQANVLKKACNAMGRNFKATFVDIKREPVMWGLYAVGSILINSADTASTLHSLQANPNWHENDPLLPRRPRAQLLVPLTVGVTLVQLQAVHGLKTGFERSCIKSASDPNSYWWRQTQAASDKYGCNYVVPSAAMLEWPVHIMIIRHNLDY